MALKRVIIGTRGSKLALRQAEWVRERLARMFPDLEVSLRIVRTRGDKIRNVPLAKIGGKGLFVKEIESELLGGGIDLAVHSMKDLPTDLPNGLTVGAVTERADVRDVLISRGGNKIGELAKGAKVGTSSLRRRAQILHFRPDLELEDIRGNLDTRLRKLERGEFDAIVLAAAGLERMGWKDRITECISTEVCLPAVGQGALGVEIREDDGEVCEMVSSLDDENTRCSVTAERALLRALGGGCQVPIAAWGRIEDGRLKLEAIVASPDGKSLVRATLTGDRIEAEGLGERLAEMLIEDGADRILEGIR